MLKLSTFWPLLLGLLWSAFAFPAFSVDVCGDEAQAPPARSAACEAALKTAIDPAEKVRLLIGRALSYSQQIKTDAAIKAMANLAMGKQAMPAMPDGAVAEVLTPYLNQQVEIDAASKAMADLEEAERLMPDMSPRMRADLLVERAEIYRRSDQPDAALADLTQAERLAPDDADPLVSRSLILFGQGNREGGADQLAKALKLEPDNTRALYRAMREAEYTGNIAGCIEYGNRALKVSPQDTRILAMRARCLAEAGRSKDMEADIQKVEEIGPWAAVVLDDMALAFLVLDRPGEAAAAARRAILMDPSFQDAYFDLTTALMATGAYDEASSTFRALHAAGIEDRIGLANNVSWELYLAGRYTDALQIVSDWIAANPEPVNEPNNIANAQDYPVFVDTAAHVLAALGRPEEAVAGFLRAAKINPGVYLPRYEERLAALGFAVKDGDAGLEAALQACVATGANCKLYADDRRR